MDLFLATNKNTLDCYYSSKERTLKTYKMRIRGASLPYDLFYEILLRLPVKTLGRFKAVCKAWFAIISSPSFIRLHLKQSASRHDLAPSFLISPHTLNGVIDDEYWPSTFSSNIPFYRWQDGQDIASLMHATDFHWEFRSVYLMSHCHGLVMLPTDTKIYVFNPATSDVLELPDGQKDMIKFQAPGLGLDLGTNSYKVVRTFCRPVTFSEQIFNMGMEVFTIGARDSCWRLVEDPPYPVMHREPMHFKGSLLWYILEDLPESSEGFLRFDLEVETFSFISCPVLASHEQVDFAEVDGELCVAQYLSSEIVIWKSPSGGNHQWHRFYVINLPEAWNFRLLTNFRSDCVLLQHDTRVYRYSKASQTAEEVACLEQLRYKNPKLDNFDFVGEDIFLFNIIPYTESLVSLSRAR